MEAPKTSAAEARRDYEDAVTAAFVGVADAIAADDPELSRDECIGAGQPATSQAHSEF